VHPTLRETVEPESKGEAMNEDDKPPFPRHRTYYVVLKYVVMALGILLAIYVFGLLWR
jgi:hypothetical protein